MAIERRRTHFLVALLAPVVNAIKPLFARVMGAVFAPPQAAETEAMSGTGFATAAQVVTTTESFTVSLNQYAGCWLLAQGLPPCLIESHPAAAAAPVAFTVFGAAPATAAVAFKVLRAPTLTGGAMGAPDFVHADADERTVSGPTAADLGTSMTLLKKLLTVYAAHRTDTLHHNNPDTTNTVASAVSDVADLPSAITAANQLKAAFNAHVVQGGAHYTNDMGNNVSSPNATDQNSLNTLLNEMRGDINAHFGASSLGGFDSWRLAD